MGQPGRGDGLNRLGLHELAVTPALAGVRQRWQCVSTFSRKTAGRKPVAYGGTVSFLQMSRIVSPPTTIRHFPAPPCRRGKGLPLLHALSPCLSLPSRCRCPVAAGRGGGSHPPAGNPGAGGRPGRDGRPCHLPWHRCQRHGHRPAIEGAGNAPAGAGAHPQPARRPERAGGAGLGGAVRRPDRLARAVVRPWLCPRPLDAGWRGRELRQEFRSGAEPGPVRPGGKWCRAPPA